MLKKMHILLLFSLLFAFSAQAQNGGASFDGVDDVITFGTPEAIQIPTEDFSFALRFKALSDPNGVYDYLFRMKDGISGVMMYLNPSNQLRTSVRGDAREQILNAGDVVTNGLYDGKVHSVVLTGDRDGSATVYIDGVDAGSLDISGIGTMGSNAYLNLGFGTLTAHMVMRDFVLYKDKVLTSAEISDYHNGVITTSNMVLHVPLNETSGLTAADASGNGNDGTVTGVTGAEEEAAFWALNHRPFVITVTTTEANESFTFYGLGGPYDIDWDGNGTFDATGVRDNQTHTYATAGTHTIRVSGLKQLYINNQADKDKYTTIEQWGTGAWTNLDNAFFGASKLTSNATDIPDFSNVTSMRSMFHSASSFTGGDIGGWDVSNVTDMGYMFYNASSFTGGDLSKWDVSNVTDMAHMFHSASSFTEGDIGDWDVSNVANMQGMFSNASSFTGGDIGGWDVSNVTDMAYMFSSASSFTGGDIGGWDVSNVTNMAHMFRAASSFTGGDIGSWDVSNVTKMVYMFDNASSFTGGDLKDWNVSNVTNMDYMFRAASSFTGGDIGGWDVSNVTNMRGMFYNASSFTGGDLKDWNVSNVTDMAYMFSNASSFTGGDLKDWNVSKVTNMDYMFSSASSFTGGDLKDWNVSKVTNMAYMFDNASSFTGGDIGGWDVSNVTNMQGMFSNASSFTGGDLKDWNVSNVTNMQGMFRAASSFTGGDIGGWDVSNVTSMRVMFHSASSFTGGDIGGWDVSNVTDMGYMFYNASSFTGGDLKDWNVSNVTDMARMFSNASSFTGGDLSKWDVSNVTSMAHVFSNASSFTGGDIGGWDVSNVTDMAYMFYNASSFTGGDISGWNVSNVTNMAHMFRAASSFTGGDLKDWDVSNVTNMVYMFYNASSFTGGDISGWNVSNVTHMQGMFSNASSFTGGDISGWNVSNVTNMAHMFNGASSFLLANDFSIWNVSNVTDMGAMFKNTVSFNGDLSKWDVSNVKNTAAMFDSALAFNGNISGWAVESVQNMAGMFRDNPVFNQDLSSWKTDSVKTMYQMFHNAAAFNQDVSGWTVANVANMDSMFTGAAAYSVENYDKILDVTNGWLKNDVQDSVVFGAPAQYTIAGQPGRNKLVNDHGWTITGDTRINVGPAFTGNFPDITFAEDDSAEVLFKTIMAIVSDPDTEPDSLDIYPIGLTNIIEGAATDSSAFFKAPANWFGKDTLQLVVSDGALNDTSDTFVVEVTAVNDAPVISGLQETLTFKAGTPAYLSLAAYASDVDNDASSLAWSFESSEDSVTAVYDSGKDTLTIEAHGAYNGGNVDLTCTVSDGELTAAAVIKLTVDPAGSLKELPDGVPTVYALHQNYPNPFNPSTTIVYSLPKAGDVKITLYNIMGQRVGIILNGYKAAGHHEVKFDASHLASGNYFYLLESKDFRKIRKMLLLK
jgi:surface protein